MERHRIPVAKVATDIFGQTATVPERTARSDRQPLRAQPLSRRYEVAYLTSHGTIDQMTRAAPALPVFEEAFCAFGHGALVTTDRGVVAVEDLLPGMLVETASDGMQTLQWVGSMTLYPTSVEIHGMEPARLMRIAADSFGHSRPNPDLMLGPCARLLYRNARCRDALGTSEAFVPAEAFADGMSVIGITPVAPVRAYHLGFIGQHIVLANGIEVESYHPGPQFQARMERKSLDLFLSLFPYASGPDGFGPMTIPRMTSYEFETLSEA